jgi:hypothetical protein
MAFQGVYHYFILSLLLGNEEEDGMSEIYVNGWDHFAVPRMVPRRETAAFWMGLYDPHLFFLSLYSVWWKHKWCWTGNMLI